MASGTFDPSDVRADTIRSAQDLADTLSALREQSGLTVRKLAKAAGLPPSTVGDYLVGKHLPPPTRPEALTRLLTALGVPQVDQADWQQMLWRLSSARDGRGPASMAPFKGLDAFDTGDAKLFFGREQERARLRALVEASAGTSQLIAVVGASGSGKTSLLRAGLLAELRRDNDAHADVLVDTVTPGPDPGATIVAALERLRASAGDDVTAALLVIDQFEEVWTLAPADSRDVALQALARNADSGGPRVLFALRADFYAEASAHPALQEALRQRQFLVCPMNAAELAHTITGPADLLRISIEPGLVDRLVTDAHTFDAEHGLRAILPQLSHCLAMMWARSERRVLTHADYEAVGRLTGAIALTAENVYANLPTTDSGLAKQLLLGLVAVEEGTPATARALPLTQVQGAAARAVLDHFTRGRLLSTTGQTVRLTHESLITAWPRLAAWVQEDRENLLTARMVAREARAWSDSGRDPELLLRGPRLASAGSLSAQKTAMLSIEEREFVALSERAATEAAEAATRRQRRMRRMLIGATTLAVVAILAVAGLVASQLSLATERDEALSRQLATLSQSYRDRDPVLATHLALAAAQTYGSVEANSALLDAAAAPRATNVNGPIGLRITAAAPAAGLLAVGGQMAQITLYDTSGAVPREVATVPSPVGDDPKTGIAGLALSDDGRWLAAGGAAATMRVWDLSDPAVPRQVGEDVRVPGPIHAAEIDPSGSIVYAGAAKQVQRWRLSGTAQIGGVSAMGGTAAMGGTLHPLQPLAVSGVASAVQALGDGRVLVGTEQGDLSLWPPDGSAALSTQRVVDTKIAAIGRSGQAVHVATRAAKAFAVPLSGDTLGRPTEVSEFSTWVNDVSVSPNTQLTAFASSDKTVQVIGAGNEVREVIPVPDNATSVDFLDDRRIAIGVLTGQTIVRDLPPYPETYSGSAVYGSGWAAGRPTAAVASLAEQDYNVGIWDVAAPLRPVEVARITSAEAGGRGSGAGDISPRGDVVAAATMDGSLVGWDVTDPTRPSQAFAIDVTDVLIQQVNYAGDDTILLPANDGYVHVVRPAGAKTTVTQRLGPAPGQLFLTSATPDLSLVAAGGSAGQVSIWRPAESSEPVGAIDWDGYLYAVALSPDGQRLAVSGSPKEVRIYDVSNPAAPRLVSTRSGAGGTTFAMEYSAHGQLAGVSNDGTVMLWAADDTGSARAATVTTEANLFHLGWSPDGTHFIAGGSDGFARVFPASPRTARERLCAGIGDHLTAEQWAAAVPDLQMPALCD